MRARGIYYVVAAVFLALGALMVVYVLSADDYRAAGASRWETRDAHAVTIAAVAACALTAAISMWASFRPRAERSVGGGCATIALAAVALILWFLAFVSNTAN